MTDGSNLYHCTLCIVLFSQTDVGVSPQALIVGNTPPHDQGKGPDPSRSDFWGMLRSIRMDIAAAIGMNEFMGKANQSSANMVSQLVLVIRNRTSHVSL